MKQLATKFATCAGIGFAPFAPGTFGSIPGVFIGALIGQSIFSPEKPILSQPTSCAITIGLISILTVISFYIIKKAEEEMQAHDPKSIVLDEVIGQMIVTSFFPFKLTYLCLGFVLFRFFDILKPWPVGHIDKNWHGPFGTLFDDVAAGLMALVTLSILSVLF